MALTLVQDAANVVVKGNFNPGIFSPSWLHANGVIGHGEHEDSKVEVITPDIAKFRCGWLDVTVTRDALQLATTVLDLLPHVPLAVMGMNRSAHFEVGGVDAWHRVGDTLAPKSLWEDTLVLAGMKSITVWGVRPDRHSGRIQVTVEPSSVLTLGIYVAHNDHFDLFDVDSQPQSRDEFFSQERVPIEAKLQKRAAALSILRDEWFDSMKRALQVMNLVYRAGSGEDK